MANLFPKRILEEGAETKMDKINNTCRRTILETLKVVLKDEYEEVLKDPVFGPILAIVENKLVYSGKIIHSFICKLLKVSKLHELWFVFANRPLRFSMQEFYAVTGLKFREEPELDVNNWKSDKGFWSLVLTKNKKINLLIIRDELLKVCNEWTYVDRVRLVYLCVIHGFVIAKDLRVFIPQEFIRLVMDFEKMRMYPWGLRAYDELIASIFKAREDLHLKNSYVLDGFSYAFQIWIMEAIPDIGSMVGKKIKKKMTKVRCRNWKGSGKVSYQDITSLESHFDKGQLFPFISSTGSLDAIDNAEFFREDEKNDERVGRIVALIGANQDWRQFTWEVETLPPNMELSDSEEDDVEEPAVVAEEPAVTTKRGKREMKSFIEGLFTSSFNSFTELVKKDIQERFDKFDNEITLFKEKVSQTTGPSDTMGKDRASEIPCPSETLGKEQEKSSQSPSPSAAKRKGKSKEPESVDPPPLRRSPRPVRKDDIDMLDFLKNLSKNSNYVDKGTQESLQDAMGNLSQASHVKDFDPSQNLNGEEPAEWVTPLSSFKPADWIPPSLKDMELHEDRMYDPDYSLVFVHEDSWAKLIEWSSTSKQLRIGPSMFTSELAARVMGPTEWLQNHEIDAMMYLFTERTSLRQWFPNKVAFMTCMFSNQMKYSFEEFRKDKKKFKVTGLLQQYGIGELPAHGRTRQMWDLDVNRMYVPLNVGKHWISMCVNFVTRSIEVFDCEGMKHNKSVEPFAALIPRIVKAVQNSSSQQLNVKKYTISYAPMSLLNKSGSDCGVYALKHIECHLLGLDFSLVNDDNIREARQKIAYDLWEAANDPVLVSRMAQFTPPKTFSNPVVEL
ncbi:hypothetical protein N665_0103s0010 [Sinapis alba]|nr:hypothetical protein N665_0103s0010 [Sinapis alba]